MKPWNRFYVFIVPTLLALVVSALAVRPAFADGGQPPVDSPAGSSPAPSAGVSAPSSGSSGQLGGHQAADDSGGHAALARQKAANPGTSSDPVWCPSGVAPRSSPTGGCSGSFPNLSTLTAGPFVPTGNGTIWVESGPASAGTFISGLGTWAAAKNFNLTIVGGWNGHNFSMGLAKANPSDPYPLSYFHSLGGDWLSIIGWAGNITLKNLTFNSVDYASIFDGETLLVQTQGNITLDRVQVFDALNSGAGVRGGAVLDNTSAGGNVKVTRSQFSHNEGQGLKILSKGSVTLQNIAADINTDSLSRGVGIDNTFSLLAKPVVVSNSEFEGNGYRGLEISSNGAITLTNLTSQNNGGRGVIAYNDVTGFQSPVTVKGVNNFSNNLVYGLSISSYGPIKVSKVTANFNSNSGLTLSNDAAATPQPITILGYVIALGNGGSGLEAYSKGTVSATHLTTSDNFDYGTYIDNTFAPSGFPKPVIISGVNAFNDNHFGEGLHILSDGAVTLANLTAERNGYTNGVPGGNYSGVLVNNGSLSSVQVPVTITGKNVFEGNGLHGLFVTSYGTVTLSNLTALDNGLANLADNTGSGVWVNNYGGTFPKPVTIKGTNVFNGGDKYGLLVNSDGAISVSHIIANNNRWNGAYLNNDGPVQAKVSIGSGTFVGNGSNPAAGAFRNGLEIHSHGVLTLSNLNASFNFGHGAFLDTKGLTSPQALALGGHNAFNFNGQDAVSGNGLVALADGKISAKNITASYNYGLGADLDNYSNWNTTWARGLINLAGVNKFIGNLHSDGLLANGNGAVIVSHVTANENGINGIDILAGNVPNQPVTVRCSSGRNNGFYQLSISFAFSITLRGWTEASPPDDNFNVAPKYLPCS